jgi:hypothetical protein
MSDVFIGLAAAVVKACIKVWSKDNAFTASAGTSVADLVAANISDELEQRRARRFFEDLEVPIAKRLRTMRETEFAGLAENEWQAATLTAADTFRKAQFTAKDIIAHDLDPLSFERHIRSGNRIATRDLSEGGTALYDRIIVEASAYVIEIANKLPYFEVGAFAELLQRSQQILARVDEVLDRIPKNSVAESDEERFATAYRRHIATKLDRLEVHGLDFDSRWYPLTVAYISLRAEQKVNAGGQALEDRIAANARTMLLGRTGSGKTTVLQWLAVSAVRSSFSGALSGLNGYFPFLIRLRDYVGRQLPVPEEFLVSTVPILADEAPPRWVRKQLDTGKALILVDGVDELPGSERGRVVVWLTDMVARFPNVIYVITARPSAVPEDWLKDIGFIQNTLESMPPSLVHAFIRNWHEAVQRQITEADEREQLENYERSLLVEITRDRYLRDLADTPLLAGLLCALNKHLHSHLPRRRSEIYERALTMFHERDQRRGIASTGPILDLNDKNLMLAEIALWMIRNGESETDSATAAKLIDKSLKVLAKYDYDAALILQFMLERSGVLREPSVGKIDYIHRTFQEYFAAKAVVDGNFMGELISNAGNDQWSEVAVLAAGQTNQVQTTKLLQGLLLRRTIGKDRYARRVLAVACLAEVRGLDYELRRQVESVIPSVVPPRSMAQAEQLSAAGSLLIKPLALHWAKHITNTAETVRAASLIGGSDAMEIIESVISHPATQLELSSELCRAWQYFDSEGYARQILAKSDIRQLDIETAAQLYAAHHVKTVNEIRLVLYRGERYDLGCLAELTKLSIVSLEFNDTEIVVTWPGPCDNIRQLEARGFPRRDLLLLPSLSNLTSLTLSRASNLISLYGIEGVGNKLSDIQVFECPNLISIHHLNHHKGLRSLKIHKCPNLDFERFTPPAGLSILLEECGGVDITPLADADAVTVRLGNNAFLENAYKVGRGIHIEAENNKP